MSRFLNIVAVAAATVIALKIADAMASTVSNRAWGFVKSNYNKGKAA